MARVCIACGLKTDQNGALAVNVPTGFWPYACGQTTFSRLRCSPSTGLWIPPEHTEITAGESFCTFEDAPIGVGAGIWTQGQVGTLVVQNPSTCRSLAVTFEEFFIGRTRGLPEGGPFPKVAVSLDASNNGSPWETITTDIVSAQWGDPTYGSYCSPARSHSTVIAPGGVYTRQARIIMKATTFPFIWDTDCLTMRAWGGTI